ncbi:hypothetical protein ACIPY6_40455 [Streptomyces sp. NPDC090054]
MSVTAHELLGEGVHPATGRLISYTACVVLEEVRMWLPRETSLE